MKKRIELTEEEIRSIIAIQFKADKEEVSIRISNEPPRIEAIIQQNHINLLMEIDEL